MTSLEQRILAIEESADRANEMQNAERRIETAKGALRRATSDLESLHDELIRFKRDREILRRVVETDIDFEANQWHSKIEQIEAGVENALTEDLQEDAREEIQQLRAEVTQSHSSIGEELDQFITRWRSEIDRKKTINELFDDQDVAQLLNRTDLFLRKDLRERKDSPDKLEREWGELMTDWKGTLAQLDWSHIRQQYDLSEEGMELIQQLQEGDSIAIVDVTDRAIMDLRQIKEVHERVRVSLE
jgi:hypothetical protein